MESSRIFVRGLPPSITEQEFRKHFGARQTITDARLFQQRRIGYVGYQTPEDAAKAVKYFNRTFIRMSKIAVELARPIQNVDPNKIQIQAQQHHREVKVVTASDEQQLRSLKRKRGSPEAVIPDPKLSEFLEVMQAPSKARTLRHAEQPAVQTVGNAEVTAVDAEESENEGDYQTIVKKPKGPDVQREVVRSGDGAEAPLGAQKVKDDQEMPDIAKDHTNEPQSLQADTNTASDADWLRSRTSRLLGLVDEEKESSLQADIRGGHEESKAASIEVPQILESQTDRRSDPAEEKQEREDVDVEEPTPVDDAESKINASQRLYVRNLAYNVSEADLRAHFSTFGELIEVHVPIDNKTATPKGFAYVQFSDGEGAIKAWRKLDGTVFQGRLLHILPAAEKRNTELDEYAISKLPLKQQQRIKRKREASSSTFNWNALYMNADAVMSSVADRLGVNKSELLDPTSSDAAVKQAHAETHVIQETKAYFKNHGVDLDAFKKRERGDTTILVKNFPYDAKSSELRDLFEEHGKVKNLLMPPTGTIAIVEFEQAPQARAAFSALAYRKVRGSVLFLEKAPKDLLLGEGTTSTQIGVQDISGKAPVDSVSSLLQPDTSDQTAATSTLFVRNLNFSTTSEQLAETFRPLDGFLSARVKSKTDAKKPGQVLSMGFGFLEFRSQSQAQAAQTAMDGYSLDGHRLLVRASHRAVDAAEERRKDDKAKKLAGRRTKIIIKNLPFEASKTDIRALFGSYGQLRSVRMPKKFDKAARGFAFADFTTPKEAENAMGALRDTHLLGRRLVLDFAAEDPEDAEAEIEKMQKKVGSQINKVALQKLTSNGRKKFSVGDQDAEEA